MIFMFANRSKRFSHIVPDTARKSSALCTSTIYVLEVINHTGYDNEYTMITAAFSKPLLGSPVPEVYAFLITDGAQAGASNPIRFGKAEVPMREKIKVLL